ncbi:MAG: hypothetical protein DHS20C01_14930 [marine bacterium B5-7]|nr:MAG: hypothetical protein DHS20C01_14930 [marine bacterium B5-7]
MSRNRICPVCDAKGLIQKTVSRSLTHSDVTEDVSGFLRSVCESCGTVSVDPTQSRHNKRLVQKFRKKADGLLLGEQILAIREKYQITQLQASKMFGGGPVAFSKYESDEISHNRSMDLLLRIASESRLVFWRLAEIAGISWSKDSMSYATGRFKPVENKTHNTRVSLISANSERYTFAELNTDIAANSDQYSNLSRDETQSATA